MWTCGADGTFTGNGCDASACSAKTVLHSDATLSGATGDSHDVTCHGGYAGGGAWICGSDGSWTGTECSSNSCVPLTVENSHNNLTEITGATGDVVGTGCNAGYSGGCSISTPGIFGDSWHNQNGCDAAQNENVCVRAQVRGCNGVWGPLGEVQCKQHCNGTIPDYQENHFGNLGGVVGADEIRIFRVNVAEHNEGCLKESGGVDSGFNEVNGNYATSCPDPVFDLESTYVEGATAVEFTCGIDGSWTGTECSIGGCASVMVPNSDRKTNALTGNTGDTAAVTCDAGYGDDEVYNEFSNHSSMGHDTGAHDSAGGSDDISGGWWWGIEHNKWLKFGPFKVLDPGNYECELEVGITNVTAGSASDLVLTVDAFQSNGVGLLGHLDVNRETFLVGVSGRSAPPGSLVKLRVPFTHDGTGSIECRVKLRSTNHTLVHTRTRIVEVDAGGGAWTCGGDGTFTGNGWGLSACAPGTVLHSDAGLHGVTGDAFNVTCNYGYKGGGVWTCGDDGLWTGTGCTSSACTTTQVANSDKSASGAVWSDAGQDVIVTCDAGYNGGGVWACGSDGSFSGTGCSKNVCSSTTVPDAFKYEVGKDYGGDLVGQSTATSLNHCATQCLNTDKCVNFAWVPRDNGCWLKTASSDSSDQDHVTSGTIINGSAGGAQLDTALNGPVVNVGCKEGTSGGGTWTCGSDGHFTGHDCSICPAGTASSGGTACVACSAGINFASGPGNTGCTSVKGCVAGWTLTGATVTSDGTCTQSACASKTVFHSDTTLNGVTGHLVNVTCHDGYQGGGTWICGSDGHFTGTGCTICPLGSASSGGIACLACSPGSTFADSTGQWSCTNSRNCPAGQGVLVVSTASADTICQNCLAGQTYSDQNSPTQTCNPVSGCGFGKGLSSAPTAASDTGCLPCAPGSYSNEVSTFACLSCPQGLVQPNSGQMNCYADWEPCALVTVPNSDRKTNALIGNEGDTVQVNCDYGYGGGGTWTCGSDGDFTGPGCADITCAEKTIANSHVTLHGVGGESRIVVCMPGYQGGGTWTCQDKQWALTSGYECGNYSSPGPCAGPGLTTEELCINMDPAVQEVDILGRSCITEDGCHAYCGVPVQILVTGIATMNALRK